MVRKRDLQPDPVEVRIMPMKKLFPRSYWVVPGQFLAGHYPGDRHNDEWTIWTVWTACWQGYAAHRFNTVHSVHKNLPRDFGQHRAPFQGVNSRAEKETIHNAQLLENRNGSPENRAAVSRAGMTG